MCIALKPRASSTGSVMEKWIKRKNGKMQEMEKLKK
jgi:hypothetical protein